MVSYGTAFYAGAADTHPRRWFHPQLLIRLDRPATAVTEIPITPAKPPFGTAAKLTRRAPWQGNRGKVMARPGALHRTHAPERPKADPENRQAVSSWQHFVDRVCSGTPWIVTQRVTSVVVTRRQVPYRERVTVVTVDQGCRPAGRGALHWLQATLPGAAAGQFGRPLWEPILPDNSVYHLPGRGRVRVAESPIACWRFRRCA